MAKDKAAPSPSDEEGRTEVATETKKDSVLAAIRGGVQHHPPRIFLYGVHGIGKTTVAAHAPSPIFICTEEGAEEVDVDKFPLAESSEDVLRSLRALYKEKHDYKTVVIDSADWMEDFIQKELRENYSDKDLSYGKDSMLAAQRVSDILAALNFLRSRKGMATIIIAHCEIKRFDSPLTEPYDRYQPKLQRSFSALMQEWADAVLFATYDVSVKREEVGFNKEVRRGVSSGDRLLYTEERPAFYAKNRYGMPPELPLSFAEIAKHIPFYSNAK